MADGITTFQGDIERFCGVLDLKVETARKKIALDLFGEVKERTPVDTGRARANWDITAGAPSQKIDEHPEAKSNYKTVKGVRTYVGGGTSVPDPGTPELGEIDPNADIFIINNLPYIEPLEHGHSQQAPTGMVEPAMTAVAGRLQRSIGIGPEDEGPSRVHGA